MHATYRLKTMFQIFLFMFILVCYQENANATLTLEQLSQGHLTLQLGGYHRTQSTDQHVNIDTLIGDNFIPSYQATTHHSNGLFGLGYFIKTQTTPRYDVTYGLNWFYLPKTVIAGTVYQEDISPNLTYAYNVTHYPLYAIAKSMIAFPNSNQQMTLNLGIGPNFMKTSNFNELPTYEGTTTPIPDQIFSNKTSTTLSATAGVGVKLNQFLGKIPLECGYQFFYLGEGQLNVSHDQVLNSLKTGALFANAVMCSVSI